MDIKYLKQVAREESFLFFVDSATRDTSVYTEPNEYEVTFNSPFQNVVGLDLIDATVPRTEYLVDVGTNTLSYTYGTHERSVVVDPGDYNVLQLVERLNSLLESTGDVMYVQPITAPVDLTNKLQFCADREFTIKHTSTIRKALGLGFVDLVSERRPGALGSVAAFQGPLPVSTTVSASSPLRQAFVSPVTGGFNDVRVYLTFSGTTATLRAAVLDAQNSRVAHGTVSLTQPVAFDSVRIPLSSLVPAQAGGQYHVVITGPAGVDIFVDGPGVSVAEGSPQHQDQWWNYASWTVANAQVCADVTADVDGFVVECPSVVDLTGEPYVLVRCPDIEQYLYRDRAFEKVHAGLGLVKLGNYGFREQRYDFVSFPPRRLATAIGKVHKLTFRLEKAGGKLYNTRGVNHHLVLAITTLVMTDTSNVSSSLQQPWYEPNPLRHLQRVSSQWGSSNGGPHSLPHSLPMPHAGGR
jgi:hypothetical protein